MAIADVITWIDIIVNAIWAVFDNLFTNTPVLLICVAAFVVVAGFRLVWLLVSPGGD